MSKPSKRVTMEATAAGIQSAGEPVQIGEQFTCAEKTANRLEHFKRAKRAKRGAGAQANQGQADKPDDPGS